MTDRLIFISCGQRTDEEKCLGHLAKQIVDDTLGYHGYFAETVQSLDGLSKNVLDNLRQCVGFISFLQYRGTVVDKEGNKLGDRSSVWVNQEIAVMAYRQVFEGVEIPSLVFTEQDLSLEGAMTALIVNPKPIGSLGEVEAEIRRWLSTTTFPSAGSEERFFAKWNQLEHEEKVVLKVLFDEGEHDVQEHIIRRCLIDDWGLARNKADQITRDSLLKLGQNNLIKGPVMKPHGNEVSLNNTWLEYIRRQLQIEKIAP